MIQCTNLLRKIRLSDFGFLLKFLELFFQRGICRLQLSLFFWKWYTKWVCKRERTKSISFKRIDSFILKISFFYKHLVLRKKCSMNEKCLLEKGNTAIPIPGELVVPPTTSQNVNLTVILVLRIIKLHLHQYHHRIYLPLADCSSPLSFSTSAFFSRKFPLARKACFFAFFRCCSFSERRENFF